MSRVTEVQTSRIRNYRDFKKDTLSFFIKMLPLGDIVSLRTSVTRPSYIVNTPDFVQEILVTKDAYFHKGRTTDVLRRTIGDGLLTAKKQEHERQKRYLQPIFYKERLRAYSRTVIEETEKLAQLLRHGETCSLQEEMMQLTLSIIAKTMFATDLDERKKELAAAISDTIEQTARTLFSPVMLPLAIPTIGHRTHKRAIRQLEDMVYEVIRDAQRDPEHYRMTLLGLLLDTVTDEGEPISEKEIRDQMMTMLLAGHETSANLLTWIFYALANNPDAERKFHQEIDQADLPAESSVEAYQALKYTQQIIQEGLRLYPPAWLIFREAAEDVELLGEPFRAGSTFMICPYAIHRNPNVFSQPDSFCPERFSGNAAANWPRFAYFPFGGGSRGCIGSRFALMEIALILYTLGKRVQFFCTGDSPVNPEPLVSLRIKGGLHMKAVFRGKE